MRTAENYINPDYYYEMFHEYDMKNSGNVLLMMMRGGVNTEMYSMNFVSVPDDMARRAVMERLFKQDAYDNVLLQITMDRNITASQRFHAYQSLKSRIEALGETKVDIVAPRDNPVAKDNPARILVGTSDIMRLVEKMKENTMVLGVKGTMALEKLCQTRWEPFINKMATGVE